MRVRTIASISVAALSILIYTAWKYNTGSNPLQGYESDINYQIEESIHHYRQGVSQISRNDEQWFIPGSKIEVLHNHFVQAYNYLSTANKQTESIKENLDRDLQLKVSKESHFGQKTDELLKHLEKTTEELSANEDEKRENDRDLRQLNRDLRDLQTRLRKAKISRENANDMVAVAGVAGIPLILTGLYSFYALAAGIAAEAIALSSAAYVENLSEKIRSMEKAIGHIEREQTRLLQDIEVLKARKKTLQSDISAVQGRLHTARLAASDLRQEIWETAAKCEHMKHFLTQLGLVMNQLERLKVDSNPANLYDVSVLREPIEELDDLLANEKRFLIA